MSNVFSFDNIEDAFSFMRKSEEEANRELADEQKALTWGSYFANFMPADNLVIFARAYTLEEIVEGERRAGADDEELAYTRTRMQDSHRRGYLFGDHFSEAEPTGELGSTHRANAWPIDKALFDAARDANWHVLHGGFDKLHELSAAFQAFRKHKMAGLR